MENHENDIVLYGTFGSIYCTRIEVALKLKGIPYKYIEEDLRNKSESLINYNPVYQKVPVLVHNGKAIAESLIILEYIDETWKDGPMLFPEDPYLRAKLRFWANFYDQKMGPIGYAMIKNKGKEQEKAIQQYSEALSIFENGITADFPQKFDLINAENLGYIDIVVGAAACNYKAFNEAINVVTDEKKHPMFFSWVNGLIIWSTQISVSCEL